MNPDSLLTVIDSLQQVVATAKDSTNYLAWFLAFTTLVAVFTAPYFQNKIAKRQIHAITVTSDRREWINKVRDIIAEFISITYKYFIKKRMEQTQEFVDSLPSSVSKLIETQEKIQLLLNPIEFKSQQLNMLVEKIINLIRKDCPDFTDCDHYEYVELVKKLRSMTQTILKEEWERVKNGK